MSELRTYTARSGQQVRLRLIQKEDAALLVDLFHNLSPESRRLRFHLYTTKLPDEQVWKAAIALSDLDPQRQMAILATIIEADGEEHAVGVARFARDAVEDKEAEVAIVVRDDFQRKGLGKHLLRILAEKAREAGISFFSAWILVDNIRLMKLIKGMELKNVESETKHGMQKIRVPIG
jgi:GNAT superfamily N-acetyltransferase